VSDRFAGQLANGMIGTGVQTPRCLDHPISGFLAATGVALATVEHTAGDPTRNLDRPGNVGQG